MQKVLLGFVFSGLILAIVAIDSFGLAKYMVEGKKESSEVNGAGVETTVVNLDEVAVVRRNLYIGLTVALITLVPIQLLITVIFQEFYDEQMAAKHDEEMPDPMFEPHR